MPTSSPPSAIPGTPSVDPVTPYSESDDTPFSNLPSSEHQQDEEESSNDGEESLGVPPYDPILWHLLVRILDMRNDSPLAHYLEHHGIIPAGSYIDLLTIPFTSPENDTYCRPGSLTELYLDRGSATRLQYLLLWGNEVYTHDMSTEEWLSCTRAHFDQFRITRKRDFDAYRSGINNGNNISTSFSADKSNSPSTSSSRASYTRRTLAEDFRRGIKRDRHDYPTLKDDIYWEKFHREFTATASAHAVERILDPNFVPEPGEDQALFIEEQKFLYNVLTHSLQTEMGKSLVIEHSKTRDAQKVYAGLVKYYTTSSVATYGTTRIMKYLTTAKYDSAWSGSSTSFLLHWKNQYQQFNDLVRPEERLNDRIARTLLSTAVAECPDMRNILTIIDINNTNGNTTDINFDQYFTLLQTAAIAYDKKHNLDTPRRSRRGTGSGTQRFAQMHEVEYGNDDYMDISYDDDTYVDDEDVAPYAINNVERAGPQGHPLGPPFVPREVFAELPQVAQEALKWYYARNKPRTPTRTPPRTPKRHPTSSAPRGRPASVLKRRANQLSIEESEEDLDTKPPAVDDVQLLETIMEPSQDPLSETDIRRVMSTSRSIRDRPPTPAPPAMSHYSTSTPTSETTSTPVPTTSNEKYNVHHTRTGTYYKVNTNNVQYRTTAPRAYLDSSNVQRESYEVQTRSKTRKEPELHIPRGPGIGSLVDGGANGGMLGRDATILEYDPHRFADITGIEDYESKGLRIVTGAALTHDIDGEPIILIMHQYAAGNQEHSIHSVGQTMAYGHKVYDQSRAVGGRQCIVTASGRILPLHFRNGLPHLDMEPVDPKIVEAGKIPHEHITEDTTWDPLVLDNEYGDPNIWHDARYSEDPEEPSDLEFIDPRINDTGLYLQRYSAYLDKTLMEVIEDASDAPTPQNTSLNINYTSTDPYSIYDNDDGYYFDPETVNLQVNSRTVETTPIDYDKYMPRLGWISKDLVKKTFQATTQMGRAILHWPMRKHYKSRNPALNVNRRTEAVATDTIYSNVPAINGGHKYVQLFVGRDTLLTDVYPLKSLHEFVNSLEDNIRYRGAMDRLLSDHASIEISRKVQDLLRVYRIPQWTSEPHHQHQNPAERRIGTIIEATNNVMNHSGAPACLWLLAITYVVFLYNHLAHASLNWATPMQAYSGSTPDITSLLQFHFYQSVYYHLDDSAFPSDSTEAEAFFVGISENVGDALTYTLLTKDTKKIIHRSSVRAADDPKHVNRRLSQHGGEGHRSPGNQTFVKSRFADDDNPYTRSLAPTFDTEDLIGRTFLLPEREDGQRFRSKVTKKLLDPSQPDSVKFLIESDDPDYEEIVSYNELLNMIDNDLLRESKDEIDGEYWKYTEILAHDGPLTPDDTNYKGSTYNVLIHWSTGEKSYEPLDVIAADDPMTCAIYAQKHNLLNIPGWKRFKRLTKRKQKFNRMLKQSVLKAFRRTKRYKFGYEIPHDHNDAVRLDLEAGNKKWQEAEHLEVSQLHEYHVFRDRGKAIFKGKQILNAPEGYQRIRVRVIYDVKHDGRHKSRIVAGGHLTPIPEESVYSGVVSIRSIRLVTFLAELNQLPLWGADIGNAYLEATTKEKVYIVAGPEFGELEGHILIINKALYGLRSSGVRWSETLHGTLGKMGFKRSKADPDVWMRKNHKLKKWEYLATYVDDLLIACEDPASIIKQLREEHKYKIKGEGPLDYHLGITYKRDADGTLYYTARKYIERMGEMYERMFEAKPKPYTSPLEKGDHPETDESELLNHDGITQYQSIIGSLQWLITLGRFDVATAVMTMSRFRAAPRVGHLERHKRICGYVYKFRHAAIRIRKELPDHSKLPKQDYDWKYSVYGSPKELIPDDIPEPLGKQVQLTTYVDANLYHDLVTGRAVTGIIHLLNGTPIEWYSKRQATVETATYGSEFVAARIATDQIIDIRDCLRYLGVPITDKAIMFGDNQSVITSSTLPHSTLNKRHNALSYHRVREAVASGILEFHKIEGSKNPADVVSKHWGYQQVQSLLKPLLFWAGDTADCKTKEDYEQQE